MSIWLRFVRWMSIASIRLQFQAFGGLACHGPTCKTCSHVEGWVLAAPTPSLRPSAPVASMMWRISCAGSRLIRRLQR